MDNDFYFDYLKQSIIDILKNDINEWQKMIIGTGNGLICKNCGEVALYHCNCCSNNDLINELIEKRKELIQQIEHE